MKKENKKLFIRTFFITCIILFCTGFFVYGIKGAYENTRQIGFGEYKKAAEIGDGFIRILDYTINFKN